MASCSCVLVNKGAALDMCMSGMDLGRVRSLTSTYLDLEINKMLSKIQLIDLHQAKACFNPALVRL